MGSNESSVRAKALVDNAILHKGQMPYKNKQKLSFGGGMNVQKMLQVHQEMQEKENEIKQSASKQLQRRNHPQAIGGSGVTHNGAMNMITL